MSWWHEIIHWGYWGPTWSVLSLFIGALTVYLLGQRSARASLRSTIDSVFVSRVGDYLSHVRDIVRATRDVADTIGGDRDRRLTSEKWTSTIGQLEKDSRMARQAARLNCPPELLEVFDRAIEPELPEPRDAVWHDMTEWLTSSYPHTNSRLAARGYAICDADDAALERLEEEVLRYRKAQRRGKKYKPARVRPPALIGNGSATPALPTSQEGAGHDNVDPASETS